jgi:hypothetical protein
MAEETCLDGRLSLSYEIVLAARQPNPSRDLQRIRRGLGPTQRRLGLLYDMEWLDVGPTVRGGQGQIVGETGNRITRVFLASEAAQTQGAANIIMNHVRGHLKVFELKMRGVLREWGAAFESRVQPPVQLTAQLVHDILQQQWNDLDITSFTRVYVTRDWPGVVNALLRVGVSRDLFTL